MKPLKRLIIVGLTTLGISVALIAFVFFQLNANINAQVEQGRAIGEQWHERRTRDVWTGYGKN